jgi:translation initiation factor 3 subunit A
LRCSQEFEARMNKLARSMDHIERARREVAAPFLEQQMKDRMEAHKAYFEAEQENLLRQHRAKWERDLPAKHATARMAADRCAQMLDLCACCWLCCGTTARKA